MKNKVVTILATAALVLTMGTAAHGAVQAQAANGHGALDGGTRQFSFSAKRNAGGTVTGSAELTNRNFPGPKGNQPYKLTLDISCMHTVGNTTYFGGLTRRTTDSNLVDAAYFSVQDNGDPGKGVDKISRVYFFDDDPTTVGDPQLCLNNAEDGFPLETIESGNIQVRS